MGRRRRALTAVGIGTGIVATVLGLGAAAGVASRHEVVSVTRTTSASVDALWALWADPDNPPRWDLAHEAATHDGPFGLGQTGTVTVQGQPATRFEIIEHRPKTAYTDRFFLPAGGTMDWQHSIDDRGTDRVVTFRVTVGGPTALVLRPILRGVLQAELPATVDNFVRVAEGDTLERARTQRR